MPHNMINEITAKISILKHTLDYPKNYRNYFVADPESMDFKLILQMVDEGLMKLIRDPSDMTGEMPVFAVTEYGKNFLDELFGTMEEFE